MVVGYTPERFQIRNSWGTSWGEKGYAWFDRRVQNQCWIAKWAEYPKLTDTGKPDEKVGLQFRLKIQDSVYAVTIKRLKLH